MAATWDTGRRLPPEHDRFHTTDGGPMWLTTARAAHRLGVTPQWVRKLARDGALIGVVTESGQRIFRRGDVQRYLLQRTEDRARSRSAVLQAVRGRMEKAGVEPRQLSLFGPRLQLVRSGPGSERPVSDAKVKPAESFGAARGSEKRSYVDRKVAP